jgi:hypothetical protein
MENQSQKGERLQRLFDLAAAKSIAVINPSFAEPEMHRFLQAVKQHPEERERVVKMFMHSMSSDYYMAAPRQFLAFCLHALRWPELRDFIVTKRADDVQRRGAASSRVWNLILAAFESDWCDAGNFQEFRPADKSPLHGSADET